MAKQKYKDKNKWIQQFEINIIILINIKFNFKL
jgi:hypothetical protein